MNSTLPEIDSKTDIHQESVEVKLTREEWMMVMNVLWKEGKRWENFGSETLTRIADKIELQQ